VDLPEVKAKKRWENTLSGSGRERLRVFIDKSAWTRGAVISLLPFLNFYPTTTTTTIDCNYQLTDKFNISLPSNYTPKSPRAIA
jgi:hypothetical protein